MTKIPYGSPGEIPPVEGVISSQCKADEFENYIREFGVVNACEWQQREKPIKVCWGLRGAPDWYTV